ncbi:MAG: hypothetical protein C0483_07470 [Pirellula sp.]|nr:hypothetical protein [Pirellula sp.]
MQEQIYRLLASNRTEEIGYDVWREYVLPPFFGKLAIGDTKKPRVIIGGRGCGKTMLLRYLSHESTFSPSRPSIPPEALSHIGLYWRSDTQFASLMQHRGVADDTWNSAFGHLAALVLGIELLRSLDSIARSACGLLSERDIASLNFERLKPFSNDIPVVAHQLKDYLDDRLAAFETWASNVRSVAPPLFLPGHEFLKRLITLIKNQLPQLAPAVFFVYIDEFENLAEYQQRIVNTWLKHSEPPLVFNLAMKRNGFRTRATSGSESLSDTHDYREFDLEEFDLDREFPVFAAEIFLLRLKLGSVEIPAIDADKLRDGARLASRREANYVREVHAAVRSIFPGVTQREMAEEVFTDATLKRRLVDKVVKALEKRGEQSQSLERFVLDSQPEASVVVPALLYRETLAVQGIADEMARLREGRDNKFTGATDWIHNNFVGCYLQLYDGLGRPCPFYSGFETYCYLARGNLRHFLELCHKALARGDRGVSDAADPISVAMQAEAARQVSADLLPEVRSFGAQGNNLHTFVLRLGSLLSLSQQSPAQSEPERTHFSVLGGDSELDDSEKQFFLEAVKWSVLFEEKGTKKKDVAGAEGIEYILNPIYAPYFHISYRKKRKYDLLPAEIRTIISGDYPSVAKLLKEFQRRLSVDLAEAPLPLFAHLTQEAEE